MTLAEKLEVIDTQIENETDAEWRKLLRERKESLLKSEQAERLLEPVLIKLYNELDINNIIIEQAFHKTFKKVVILGFRKSFAKLEHDGEAV